MVLQTTLSQHLQNKGTKHSSRLASFRQTPWKLNFLGRESYLLLTIILLLIHNVWIIFYHIGIVESKFSIEPLTFALLSIIFKMVHFLRPSYKLQKREFCLQSFFITQWSFLRRSFERLPGFFPKNLHYQNNLTFMFREGLNSSRGFWGNILFSKFNTLLKAIPKSIHDTL